MSTYRSVPDSYRGQAVPPALDPSAQRSGGTSGLADDPDTLAVDAMPDGRSVACVAAGRRSLPDGEQPVATHLPPQGARPAPSG